MDELVRVRDAVKPHEHAAGAGRDDRPGRRQRRRGVPRARSTSTASCMTKLDGDARGGAALSVRAVTGMPIKFASVGEKLDAARGVPPRPHGLAHPRHGRRALADRARRGDARRGGGQGARAEAAQGGVHAGRPARPAAADPQDGVAGLAAQDDPRRRQADAGHERGRPAARPRRGDDPLDDAGGAPRSGADQRLASRPHRQRGRARACSRSTSCCSSTADEEDDEADRGAARCPDAGHARHASERAPRASATRKKKKRRR